jgi:conjugation system TraG family ATPase
MKTEHPFVSPYLGISTQKYAYTCVADGDYAVVFRLQNQVLQYAADTELYYQYHQLYDQIISIMGPGHSLQKHDVFIRKQVDTKQGASFLDQKYHNHFQGRKYAEHVTYLTLTRNVQRKRFFVSDPNDFNSFLVKLEKVKTLLESNRLQPQILDEKSLRHFIRQMLTQQFTDQPLVYHNLIATPDHLQIGEDYLKSFTLIDAEQINLPASINPHTELHTCGFPLPVDLMHFLSDISGYQSMIYHQVLKIPNQESVFQQLRMKRKRHESIPDPANLVCVRDIDALLDDVAKHSRVVVYAHYNILIRTGKDKLHQTGNDIESQLFKLGILPSRNDANQLELFRTVLPGNSGELKSYDRCLTSADAGICLMYKERFPTDDPSPFQISFSDRKGIPIAVDTNDLPMRQGRINNRNKFVLGPSGSGKSFFMNHLVRQYYQYDMDIVLVDTGHSYEGLCSYYGGQYITYSEDKPITMNPFRISKEEFNEEKREFLKALIGLLWKGTNGILSQIEDTMLGKVILQYYKTFWSNKHEIESLCFDTFYTYSVEHITAIANTEKIPFDLDTYRFVLKKFCLGGQYANILNEDMEASLFDAPFIVFEIDAIKEHKILFPVTTLIIMDVFLQKMRLKTNRKCLIIEEAWKAVASPMMAGYILYLYKTIRKFRGEAVVVTQELDDIIGNQIVKDSIISNSDTVCLLDQSRFRDNYEEIAKLLSLNETEQRKIFTVNKLDNREGRGRFKEVYIKRGGVGEVYGVEVSLEEYLTYTTERAEKDALKHYLLKHKNYQKAIEAFVSDLKSSGLPLNAFVEKVIAER